MSKSKKTTQKKEPTEIEVLKAELEKIKQDLCEMSSCPQNLNINKKDQIMADTVAVTKLAESQKHVWYLFTNKSDGTGESGVQKIDISTLSVDGSTVTSLSLVDIAGTVTGFDYAELLWDQSTDVTIGVFSGDVDLSFESVGGRHDSGSGGNGDVLLTTSGGASGSSYNLVSKWKKKV